MTENKKQRHVFFMKLAIKEAVQAAALGEVPIGAVVVDAEGRLLAAAGNRSVAYSDPSGHAEILALREAGQKVHNYRLPGTSVYVTLEPCLMCMGAMIHARVDNLIFAAPDPKTGAVISRYQIGRDGILNHTISIEHGVCARESSEMLRAFFKERRK